MGNSHGAQAFTCSAPQGNSSLVSPVNAHKLKASEKKLRQLTENPIEVIPGAETACPDADTAHKTASSPLISPISPLPNMPLLITEEDKWTEGIGIQKEVEKFEFNYSGSLSAPAKRRPSKWCETRGRKIDPIEMSPHASDVEKISLKRKSLKPEAESIPEESSPYRESFSSSDSEEEVDENQVEESVAHSDEDVRSGIFEQEIKEQKFSPRKKGHSGKNLSQRSIPYSPSSRSTTASARARFNEMCVKSYTEYDRRRGYGMETPASSRTPATRCIRSSETNKSEQKSANDRRLNVFTDPMNWVDPEAVFAWKVVIENLMSRETEEVCCYSNSTVRELIKTYTHSAGIRKPINLFKLQKGKFYCLKHDWNLQPMVRNRSTVYAFSGTQEQLDEAMRMADETTTVIGVGLMDNAVSGHRTEKNIQFMSSPLPAPLKAK
eukprot:CAMPEP_0184493822 /NCGR_PEP_ID=MMETSP0113_2-20130426/27034_1 /TAXON_ID=91329 /ORGANISM="Norrisiella sphaerica, Strain BC52" /LENGTH=436 /DNA_ID=CAMNT_0026879265 /DNA_START=157 /DNA_END=1467 /DNA_ORIENTATION=+